MAIKKKFVQVEEDYIKQIHSEVCSEWKKKIENKFPEVFPVLYMKLNKKFVTESGDTCILIKSPLDNSRIKLIYDNGGEILDCTPFFKNGKLTQNCFSNEIHEKFIKYI